MTTGDQAKHATIGELLDALSGPSAVREVHPLPAAPPGVWLVQRGEEAILLKPGRLDASADDVGWEHRFLDALSATGFPASRPLRVFGGRSWMRVGDRVWGALSYLPGRPMLWERRPTMAATGAFLAAFHAAVGRVASGGQRPSAVPVADLSERTPWAELPATLGSPELVRRFRQLLDELIEELQDLRLSGLSAAPIHGDFTTDNILIDGTPATISGLIDFGSAYREVPPADLAFGLWRSGRAAPGDVALDVNRVISFVHGYHRRLPLSEAAARAIPVLIKARGLQLVVRAARRAAHAGARGTMQEPAVLFGRVEWARTHQRELTETILRLTQ